MCRLLGIVSSEPTDFKIVLREAPLSMAALSKEHRDGWGIAVFDDEARGWCVEKGVACASEDARFHQLAVGSRGFASQARLPVLAAAAAIGIAAVVGRRQFVPAALWAVRHLGGAEPAPGQPAGAHQLAPLLVLGSLNWLFDAAALFAALAAMGTTIPVRGVVVAYSLGQLVSAIPILPGGGGTIEATMVGGLMLAGGMGAAVVSAVVLYRIVSAWGLVPLGWGLWRMMPSAHLRQLEPAAIPT